MTISYQGSQLTELCHDYEEFVAEVGADNVCVDLVYYSRPLKQDEKQDIISSKCRSQKVVSGESRLSQGR